jgi:hypothetical protein
MRATSAFLVALLLPAWTWAAPPQKLYYVGEVKLSSGEGKPMGSQAILIEKILDSEKSEIIERAAVVKPDGSTEEYTAHLAVRPDNSFTMTDEARTVEGTGKLFGPAWKWTYFKATFKAKNGVTIEDENFMTDDSVATARKKVMAPGGKVVMYMEMSVKGVTPKTYEILRAGLLKK